MTGRNRYSIRLKSWQNFIFRGCPFEVFRRTFNVHSNYGNYKNIAEKIQTIFFFKTEKIEIL